jgi:hypothetical protein
MQSDDEDDVIEKEGGVFSEPKSLFRRFVEGNNRITLIFIAMTIAAIFASAIMSGHARVSYSASPPGIRHLFWFAGASFLLAFFFLPDKDEIVFGFRGIGIGIGSFWFDGWRDWLLFGAVAVGSCALLCAAVALT